MLFLSLTLLLGFGFGFIAQRQQFCFSGGIKDIILFKHSKRTASLFVAITTALISTQAFLFFGNISLDNTRYYKDINYLLIGFGGALFGYGMMVSDGCSSRHLIKVAQGEKDSFFVLIVLGIFAFFTYKILSLYGNSIYNSTILNLFHHDSAYKLPFLALLFALLLILYKTLPKLSNILQTWDGFFIGLSITLGWVLTYYFYNFLFIDISMQSLSFVYPLGKTVEYFVTGFNTKFIFIFPVITIFGVVLGAFISSKTNKKYSKKQMCDNSMMNPPGLAKKLFGAACMGIGGILAIGCTVGQGLSGLSTLSLASFYAITSIYISAYITGLYMHNKNALIACFIFDFEDKK
jgi:uncharacterized membrane protein YedE/YeeE